MPGGRRRRRIGSRLRERDRAAGVGARQRPGQPNARRSPARLEPRQLERDRATHIPRVRHHEAARLVQLVKGLDLRVLLSHAGGDTL